MVLLRDRPAEPFGLGRGQGTQLTQEQVTQLPVGPQRGLADALTPAQLTALGQVQQYELAAAAADFECGQKLYPLVEQVHREYLAKVLNGS